MILFIQFFSQKFLAIRISEHFHACEKCSACDRRVFPPRHLVRSRDRQLSQPELTELQGQILTQNAQFVLTRIRPDPQLSTTK